MMLNIEWRTREGLGDFITGLCYAHSATIKYRTPVHITFHWPNPKDTLLSDIDKESINYRFDYVRTLLRPVEGLEISHKYESIPEWRFINEFEEFNPVHGLWYPKETLPIEKGLVVHWSSRHNLEFPGYHKDPLYDYWPDIIGNIRGEGYNVVEVTYRTPIQETMNLIRRCEFGVGYEGMVHQLFKFVWRPLICASRRYKLSRLLCAQAHIIEDPNLLLYGSVKPLVKESHKNINRLLTEHKEYMDSIQDPTKHKLFNIPT